MPNGMSRLWSKWSDARAEERARVEAAEQERRAQQAQTDAMMAKIQAQFPERSFPLIPADVLRHYTRGEPVANLRETFDLWRPILDRWPEPVRTDKDRKRREAEFWAEAARRHVVRDDDGAPALQLRQGVLDYYHDYEKWILRTYFAATGTVRETWYGRKFIEITREYMQTRAEYDGMMNTSLTGNRTWDTGKANNRSKDERFKEADRKLEAYLESKNHHMQEQGGWYFHHVEQAFEAMQIAPTDRPSSEI